ncbi:hypothetical protein, partial [Caballeronia arvi]|uniref:hypothetical protein n=1 Tax=Caballeronia arvi TaxID=1777135 RepID=UPI001F4101AC
MAAKSSGSNKCCCVCGAGASRISRAEVRATTTSSSSARETLINELSGRLEDQEASELLDNES